MKANLFISHSSRDAPMATLVQAEIERLLLGAVLCFNTSKAGTLAPGAQWLDRIVSTLRDTDVLLALLTPAGLASSYVHFEAGSVWIQPESKVVPCVVGATAKGALPSPYNQLQAVDLGDPADLTTLLSDLAARTGLTAPNFDAEALAGRITDAAAASTSAGDEVTPDDGMYGNRRELSVEIEWRYSRSAVNPRHWAATHLLTTEFEVTADELRYIGVDFSPSLQAIGFSDLHPPRVALLQSVRSSEGTIRQAGAHQHSGSKFAYRIYFEPALRRGDVVKVKARADFPEYKLGILEDFVAVILATHGDVRDYDFNSRNMNRQIDRFVYRVILPKELGALPLAPSVTRHSHEFLEEQAFLRAHPEVFRVREVDVDGVAAWEMELRRDSPPFRAAYQLRWRLPREADVAHLLD